MNVARSHRIACTSAVGHEDRQVGLRDGLKRLGRQGRVHVAFREEHVVVGAEDWWRLRDVCRVANKGRLIVPL